MSESVEKAAAAPMRGSRAHLILAALVIGIVLGALMRGSPAAVQAPSVDIAAAIGGIWLNALKMTVIPLVVALMVTAVAKGADATRTGRVAAKSTVWIASLYLASALLGALVTPVLLRLMPLSSTTADALRSGIAAIDSKEVSSPVPGVSDFFQSLIPGNVFESAAAGEILPLVIFSLLFALALSRVPAGKRQPVLQFFEGLADALLVLIKWVLWVGPLGVFALAFTVGNGAGGAALSAVLHYVVIVSAVGVAVLLTAYVLVLLATRIRLRSFAQAMLGPQTVAISTQSSLVSLPAMLGSAKLLGIRDEVADITLPLAVALFRGSGPAMNLAVVLYIAHLFGAELSLTQMIAAAGVASLMSYSSVSLPGQIGFFASIAPIAIAAGVPLAPLALFVAVETIPDIFRTLSNVTLDVAITGAVDRNAEPGGEKSAQRPAMARTRSE